VTQPLAELADSVTQVPLVDGGSTRFVNFDYAASAPPLRSTQADVARAMSYYASIHRGQSYLSRVSTAAYERSRETIAEFLHARDADVVVFTRNTTDALNLLANAVPGPVLHLDVEHHANLLPWRTRGEFVAVPAGPTVGATLSALEAELAGGSFALLTVTGASNVTGECLPVEELAAMAHRYGARLAVDGAQLAPHRHVNLRKSGIDYIAVSGHKLYAPYGAGALIGRRDWLDSAYPHQPGGGAVLKVGLDSVDWKLAPARHEGGTPNLVGAVGLASSIQSLHELGFDLVREHEMALYSQLVSGLDRLGISVLRIWPDHDEVVGVASFAVPGYRADLVAAYLSAEHGIGVRGGKFCAHPLLERLGMSSGAVRASIGLGTSGEDVDLLIGALDRLLSSGPSWTYASVDGYISPDPDPRPPAEEALAAAL
jgi:selenocysteine lyase/cysteine desulfurase